MYNYMEVVKEDVKIAIEQDYNPADYDSREEFEDALNDELWNDDSITGNASGSYTFNTYRAKMNVIEDGENYLQDMADDGFLSMKEVGERFIDGNWEWFDVSIRCYILPLAIAEVLDEMKYNREE